MSAIAAARMAFDESVVQARSAGAGAELRRLGRRGGTYVVGPWLSEVGFELLYWRPLLAWWMQRHDIAPEQVVVVTRGGAGLWYEGLCAETHDVFDVHTPEELQDAQERRYRETRSQKQLTVRDVDLSSLAPVLERHPDATVVHPRLMYRMLAAYWARRRPISFLERRMRWLPVRDPGGPGDLGLPSDYVAVKAYFSSCFPDTPGNRRFLSDLLSALASASDVVLLSTRISVDDHEEWEDAGDRIHTLHDRMEPTTNLAVQTRAISGARALFSTYGGFSYLGPFLDVPSYSFFSERNHNLTHLDAMQRASHALHEAGHHAGFTATTADSAAELLRLAACAR